MDKTTKKLSVAVLFLAMSTGSAFAQKKTTAAAPKPKAGKTVKAATGVILPTPAPDNYTHYETKAACKEKEGSSAKCIHHIGGHWYNNDI